MLRYARAFGAFAAGAMLAVTVGASTASADNHRDDADGSGSALLATGRVYHYGDTTLIQQWLNPGDGLCKGMQETPAGQTARMVNDTDRWLRVYTHPSCTGGFWELEPGWSGPFNTGRPRGFVPLPPSP